MAWFGCDQRAEIGKLPALYERALMCTGTVQSGGQEGPFRIKNVDFVLVVASVISA